MNKSEYQSGLSIDNPLGFSENVLIMFFSVINKNDKYQEQNVMKVYI